MTIRPLVRSSIIEGSLVVTAFALGATAFWLGAFVRHFRAGPPPWGTFDLLMYFYPKYVYGAAALGDGRLPLWNPHEFCGMPFLATAQVAALYPVKHLVFGLLPGPLALHANYVVHLVLAGAFAHAYARWQGLGVPASLVAGTMWAFNALFVTSTYHPNRVMVLAWVPLVLLLYERALLRRTVTAAALAGAAVGIQSTAGYPAFVLCLAGFLALATLFHVARAARERAPVLPLLATAGAAACFAAAFAAPQVLPLAELVGETSRVELVARSATAAASLATGVTSAIVQTAGALLFSAGPATGLALAGLLVGRFPLRGFLLAALLIVHVGPLLQGLPGFDLFRVAYSIWGTFTPLFVALLVAWGFERLGTGRAYRTAAVGLLLGVPLLKGGAVAVLGVVPVASLLGLAVGAAVLVARRRPALLAPAAAIVAGGVLTATLVALPYREGTTPYPRTQPDPVLAAAVETASAGGRVFGASVVRRGEQMLSELRAVSGYEFSLRPLRVGRLLDAAELRDRIIGASQPDWTAIIRHRPLLDLLGVSLLIVDAPGAPPEGLVPGPILPDGRATLRNPSALPRAFLVHRARGVSGPEEAYAAVVDPAFRPAVEAVVEGKPPPLALTASSEHVRIALDEPERVEIVSVVAAPALLVVTDGLYPGWDAKVDGRPVPIVRTNYAFRGVPLAPGEHHVVFRYRPVSFRLGVWLALGAAAVAATALARRRQSRRGRRA